MDTTLLPDSEYHTPVLNLTNKTNAEKIKELTKGFLPNKRTLLEVSQIFTDEIELGLSLNPIKKSSLIMANTFITQPPDGNERGKFMSLDLGSSNFRVVLSEYNPDGTNKFHLKHYTVPQKFRRGESKHLFYFFAECIKDFVDTFLPNSEDEIAMGFTFSFPMVQKAINVAILETWTKDFDCPDAVGKNAAQLLQEAIDEHKGLKVKLVATLNDTTGTLVQGLFYDPTSAIGLILGTGSNACYIEKIENVKYWVDRDQWIKEGYEWVIIDMECGGFGDNGIIDFAKTKYDQSLDRESLFPHSYTFEKLLGGKFLGEIIRRVILDLAQNNLIFNGKISEQLKQFEIITAHDLSAIESFHTKISFYAEEDEHIYGGLASRLGYKSINPEEKEVIRYVCAIVSVRAALMLAALLSNLIIRIDRPVVTIAVDGSVYKYHPKLHKLITDFITQLVPEKKKFKLILAEDGSGKGAGLVAAIATKLKH